MTLLCILLPLLYYFFKYLLKKKLGQMILITYLTFARHCHVDFQKEFVNLILVESPCTI